MRVAELEKAAQARDQQRPLSSALKASPKAGPFFGPVGSHAQSNLTAEDWSKLQMLAGSPPPRVGAGERRRGKVPTIVNDLEGAFANLEKEAEEPDEVPKLLDIMKQDGADPVHRLLAIQLQQNQALLERLVEQKPADPVMGVLAGSEGSSQVECWLLEAGEEPGNLALSPVDCTLLHKVEHPGRHAQQLHVLGLIPHGPALGQHRSHVGKEPVVG